MLEKLFGRKRPKHEVVTKIVEILPIQWEEDFKEVDHLELAKTKWGVQIGEGTQDIVYQDVLVNVEKDEEIDQVDRPYTETIVVRRARCRLFAFKHIRYGWVDIRDFKIPCIKIPKQEEMKPMFADKGNIPKLMSTIEFEEYDFLRVSEFGVVVKDKTEEELIDKVKNELVSKENEVLEQVRVR